MLPEVWPEPFISEIVGSLRLEAAKLFRIHQLPTDPKEWETRRHTLRERIWKSVGVRYDAGVDLDLQETGSITSNGYSIRKVFYQSQKGLYVTGNLFVPDGPGPFPAVLCMHGHWSQGRLAERVQARGHSLAKSGYVCLTVDAFGSGERSTVHGEFEYHGAMLASSLLNIGETLMGIQIVDNMRGIDVLASLPFVQADRIGATGASGGGNQTMWLAAMDDRVRASVPVVSVGTFESYIGETNCACETLPDGLTYMEESAALALAAPHAMKICNCLGDSNKAFFPSEMLRSFEGARKVFQALGADEKFSYQVFNRSHGYWPEIREAMLGWFDLHLRGTGHGAPRQEQSFETLPEADLMVFKKGQRPPEVMSIAEYCRKKGAAIRKTSLSQDGLNREGKLEELAQLLRIKTPLKYATAHWHSPSGGWERVTLETECGRLTPLLLKKPREGTDFYLLAGPDGKGELKDAALFKEASASGAGIVAFDLWGTGETTSPDGRMGDAAVGVLHHDLSRYCLWLGRTMIGEWTRDYRLLANWLKETQEADTIHYGGYKDAAPAALFASLLSESDPSVLLDQGPVSYVFANERAKKADTSSFYSMALHVPGIIPWGDIPLAVKLARNVRILNPRLSDGEACPAKHADLAPIG